MITGLETGEVELLWIAATNPVVSMPDLERTKAALLRSPFTIYQEAYYPTETSAYAHILLPATQWSEKTGVMTNSERRVTFCPGFDTPSGEARDDWSIFAEVGRRLGFAQLFAFDSVADVYKEYVQLTQGQPCDITGLSHEYLRTKGPSSGHAQKISLRIQPKKRNGCILTGVFTLLTRGRDFRPITPGDWQNLPIRIIRLC